MDSLNSLEDSQKPPFSPEEIRILGCLMEKQLTTPNNYPLTMNSLMLACNQKTSREPLMNLAEGEVGHIVRGLIEFGWTVIQNSGRAQRVEHKASRQLKLNQQQQAILAVLMLRAPQTLNEIRTRTERMADFTEPEAVAETLQSLLQTEPPLAVRLPAGAGRREDRYYHRLGRESLETLMEGGSEQDASGSVPTTTADSSNSRLATLEQRLLELEQRVAELEALLQ
ncbi:MAG: YceH family protein [Thiothrix sp.]|nr:YceH family protein [Thiothrix sp.]HPE59750.1 YceH family protein [Thiolinea sp.]